MNWHLWSATFFNKTNVININLTNFHLIKRFEMILIIITELSTLYLSILEKRDWLRRKFRVLLSTFVYNLLTLYYSLLDLVIPFFLHRCPVISSTFRFFSPGSDLLHLWSPSFEVQYWVQDLWCSLLPIRRV